MTTRAPISNKNTSRRNAGNSGKKNTQQRAEKIEKHPSAAKQALKFAFMPEIGRSFGSVRMAFGLLINLVVQLFVVIKLISEDHPSVALRNAGDYKLTQVIGIAFNNIIWSRKNIPQIVMFFAILAFLFFMSLSVITIVLQVLTNSAFAQGITDTEATDIATGILDGLFNVNGTGGVSAALTEMLRFYSTTMLCIGGILLIYMVIGRVMETASTGVPFGKNFSHTWAPIRIVVAIGLLVPLSGGLNSGQYIILYLVKWGSGVATTVFEKGSGALNLGGGTTVESSTAGLSPQPVYDLFNAEKCRIGNNIISALQNNGNWAAAAAGIPQPSDAIKIVREGTNTNAIFVYKGSSISGQQPCGAFSFPHKSDHDAKYDLNSFLNGASGMSGISEPTEIALYGHFKSLAASRNEATQIASELAAHLDPNNVQKYFTAVPVGNLRTRLDDLANNYFHSYKGDVETAINAQKNMLQNNDLYSRMTNIGWIGAGLWIHELARKNVELQTAIRATNVSTGVPTDGTDILNGSFQKRMEYVNGNSAQRHSIEVAETAEQQGDLIEQKISQFIKESFNFSIAGWFSKTIVQSANPYEGFITVGSGLITIGSSAIVSGLLIIGASTFTGLGNSLGGGFATGFTPLLYGFAGTLISAGVILSIMLPLLPTMRFFAAILGWILLVFTAILAVPLVALAHLKTDGDGLPGQMAQGAYMMIAGIVLRPVFVVIAMFIAFLAFNAISKVVGVLFIEAYSNATGPAGGGGGQFLIGTLAGGPIAGGLGYLLSLFIKQFALCFALSTFVIALANSCFKVMDIIPDRMMTWIGSQAINAGTDDDTQQAQLATGAAAMKLGGALNSPVASEQARGQVQANLEKLISKGQPGSITGASEKDMDKVAGAQSRNSAHMPTGGEPGGGGASPSSVTVGNGSDSGGGPAGGSGSAPDAGGGPAGGSGSAPNAGGSPAGGGDSAPNAGGGPAGDGNTDGKPSAKEKALSTAKKLFSNPWVAGAMLGGVPGVMSVANHSLANKLVDKLGTRDAVLANKEARKNDPSNSTSASASNPSLEGADQMSPTDPKNINSPLHPSRRNQS